MKFILIDLLICWCIETHMRLLFYQI